MERFAIRAELVTPAIISMLTLDGLLGALLFEELQDVDQAHAAIPLQCTDGLYHASMALPVGPVVFGKHLKFNTSGTSVVDFIGNGCPIADYKAGLVRFSGVGSANSKAAKSDF